MAAGNGVALVPESAEALRRRGVAYRPLLGAAESAELIAILRREANGPVLQAFPTAIRTLAAA